MSPGARSGLGALAGFAALAAAGLLSGCGRLSDGDAEALVRRYNGAVIAAYRTGDESRLGDVAAPREAGKVGATIGVKRDLGLVLDARLLELAVTGVERDGGEVRVRTRERWWYQDLDAGGRRAGQDSTDAYELTYRLVRTDAGWRVAAVEFASPPKVGREAPPPGADLRTLHGLPPAPVDQ